jgi:hypothetical protein
MTNVEALAMTLGECRRMGRLELVDSARVQALESMAGSLDLDPSNAALWRQYREALGELTADDGSGAVDDAIEGLFGQVRNPSSS